MDIGLMIPTSDVFLNSDFIDLFSGKEKTQKK